jgi:hypothetical protein
LKGLTKHPIKIKIITYLCLIIEAAERYHGKVCLLGCVQVLVCSRSWMSEQFFVSVSCLYKAAYTKFKLSNGVQGNKLI